MKINAVYQDRYKFEELDQHTQAKMIDIVRRRLKYCYDRYYIVPEGTEKDPFADWAWSSNPPRHERQDAIELTYTTLSGGEGIDNDRVRSLARMIRDMHAGYYPRPNILGAIVVGQRRSDRWRSFDCVAIVDTPSDRAVVHASRHFDDIASRLEEGGITVGRRGTREGDSCD